MTRAKNVSLKNVTLTANRGARLEYVNGLSRDNVNIAATGDKLSTMTNTIEAAAGAKP